MKTYNLVNNVNLNVIETKKFKHISINFRFLFDLDRKLACSRSMLAMMMTNRSHKYPTNQAFTSFLDDNYGMSANMNTYGLGGSHIITLKTSGVDSKYISEKIDIFAKQLELLKEIILNPLIEEDGFFNDELFEEAKMILKAKKLRRLDDPTTFALDENYNVIGKDNYLSISCLGEISDIDALSKEKVSEAYHYLINKSKIEIFVSGDVDAEEINNAFKEANLFIDRSEQFKILMPMCDFKDNKVEIKRNIDQSNVILTWVNDIMMQDNLYFPLRLGNVIFGGDSESLLFKEIREKRSLCYSVFSSIVPLDHLLIAYAGISYENLSQTIDLMKALMTKMVNGDFEDEKIAMAKLLYINNLKSQLDSDNGLVNYEYQQKITNNNFTLEATIEKVNKVTKDEIVSAMKKNRLICEFVLKEGAASE